MARFPLTRETHNAASLRYQDWFFPPNGRWPTWLDAMADCADDVKKRWRKALEAAGVDVDAGNLILRRIRRRQ